MNTAESVPGQRSDPAPPTFREALRFWVKLGFISFGGPAGQIATLQTELVERRRWIGQERFMHALNFCMLLPGPEAQQLATYCGWLLHRTRGGIAAGALFVLPSAVLLWLLSFVYVRYGQVPWVADFMRGLQPAVLAVIVAAILRIGRHALRHPLHGVIAASAFVLLAFANAPFPAVVFGAAAVGALGSRLRPDVFAPLLPTGAPLAGPCPLDDTLTGSMPVQTWARALRILTTGLILWWTPVVLAGLWQGWSSPLAQAGLFFSKAALVTFGGAYAVLPYVGQQAVEVYGWLSPAQMIDGLAFAETTPGPLIMVLQFVGFMGGWNQPGTLGPLASATWVASLTTWVTFVPCFLWIFLGAPSIERLRGHASLNAALASVTAAVVGVVLNLAVWFGRPVLFNASTGIDYTALAIAAASFVALHRFKLGLPTVLVGAGLVGLMAGRV